MKVKVSTSAGKDVLTRDEKQNFSLGKLIGVVEDVFNEPEGLGREIKVRPVQPHSYNFSSIDNWRLGFMRRGNIVQYNFYTQSVRLDGRPLPIKNPKIQHAASSVRYLVKKLQLYPQNVQETCMYVFQRATVFTHWYAQDEMGYGAWVNPTKLSDSDWYFLGVKRGLEIPLLHQMRQNVLDLTRATYSLI